MTIQVNKLEVAAELADKRLIDEVIIKLGGCSTDTASDSITEEDENGNIRYTEETQEKFGQYYEEYLDILQRLEVPQESSLTLTKHDIQNVFTCTDKEAKEVIDSLNNDERLGDEINFSINYHGVELGLTLKEE